MTETVVWLKQLPGNFCWITALVSTIGALKVPSGAQVYWVHLQLDIGWVERVHIWTSHNIVAPRIRRLLSCTLLSCWHFILCFFLDIICVYLLPKRARWHSIKFLSRKIRSYELVCRTYIRHTRYKTSLIGDGVDIRLAFQLAAKCALR